MSDTPLQDRLDELRIAVAAANAADRKARDEVALKRKEAPKEVTADLREFTTLVEHRSSDAPPVEDRPARHRELTKALCEAIIERGLVFDLTQGFVGSSFDPKRAVDTVRIFDPAVDTGTTETHQALLDAQAALSNFQDKNTDALESERRAADAKEIADAHKSGDKARIRRAIGVDPDISQVLTSDEVRPDRVTEPEVRGGTAAPGWLPDDAPFDADAAPVPVEV